MQEFIIYIAKSAACLSIFFTVYYLFLRGKTFFTFNRAFLLVSMLVSFVLPFIQFSYEIILPATNPIAVATTITTNLPTESFNIWSIIGAVYLLGTMLCLSRNIISFARLYKLKKEGTKLDINGYKILESKKIESPFSFIDTVYINTNNLSNKEIDLITKHEISHIEQKHWIDLLCSECALMLQWFNPLMWFYKHLLKENHEYLADQEVLNDGESTAIYQAVLINQTFKGSVFSFANSFNYSNNLKRLTMMKQNKTAAWKKAAILMVLPLFGIFFTVSAKPNYVPQKSNDEVVVIGKSDKEKKSPIKTIASMGENPPLVYLDGIEITTQEMKNLDPNTIEKISVLKNESAIKLYGEKGENGVILITLKK